MSLLNYNSYEEYLDSFLNINDIAYLRNWDISRQFIQNACGKSCMGRLLSRSEFEVERVKLEVRMNPRRVCDSTLFGNNYTGDDPVLRQFAARELKLLKKQISTIVFLIMRSKKGLNISGYIDLEQSMRESRFKDSEHYVNWPAIFEGKAKLMPRPNNLSYFDWHLNKMYCTDSDNYSVVTSGAHSLLMKHRGDHKIICVNAECFCSFHRNAERNVYSSDIYGDCLFFDHIVRRIN
ncbi:cilia- and flagella-associated protein 299 [Drosophila hydei]|uniref:Cilia- and flagella-associated protein 299 n=1 Tax=Drosophila hydei TaxID=7224 RepID=A0A6J1LW84_DROHY|nr:cilia- and flagella-associated protein 299 [Drosophila hydei]